MAHLGPLPARKVFRALQALGFQMVRQKGSHVLFQHPDGRATVVPNHPTKEIHRGLLRQIIQDADVSVEEFLEHT